jgi:hypothetical protein
LRVESNTRFPVEAISTRYGCGSAARAMDAWRSAAAASPYSAAAKNDGHRACSAMAETFDEGVIY